MPELLWNSRILKCCNVEQRWRNSRYNVKRRRLTNRRITWFCSVDTHQSATDDDWYNNNNSYVNDNNITLRLVRVHLSATDGCFYFFVRFQTIYFLVQYKGNAKEHSCIFNTYLFRRHLCCCTKVYRMQLHVWKNKITGLLPRVSVGNINLIIHSCPTRLWYGTTRNNINQCVSNMYGRSIAVQIFVFIYAKNNAKSIRTITRLQSTVRW